MRRLAIFAHYDAKAEVKRFVLHYLQALRDVCDDITFVSTSPLSEVELAKLAPTCGTTIIKDNVGLDFGMWQRALAVTDLDAWDEIVLVNSSVFGPVRPLADVFARMAASDCDYWGMTNNQDIAPHLQSYFLVFRTAALRSPGFRQFWENILPYRDKRQIIRSYEVGLSTFMSEKGLRSAVVAPAEDLSLGLLERRGRWKSRNPTCYYPLALLKCGMPFVKVELLRDNPGAVPLGPVYRAMREAGYDVDLVEFDRPFTRRWNWRSLFHDPRWSYRRLAR